MNSHNTKPVSTTNDAPADTTSDSVRVLNIDLVEPEGLEIADDPNPGGDPYNSTGQHVIIKSRIDLED